MSAAYDLHIHSCLSPCAADDMTPANIAAMAKLKGLNIISLTDHNCGANLAAMDKAARQNGLVFIPGIEVTTREEVHVLVYFADLSPALRFADTVYASLPDIGSRPDIFGNQIVMDEDDRPSGTRDKLLLQACAYTIEEIADMANRAGGCAVPAHINRDSFSVISNLGFIPDGLFKAVEVVKALPCPAINPGYKVLHSSDAHQLGDISEPINALPISSGQDFIHFSAQDFFRFING